MYTEKIIIESASNLIKALAKSFELRANKYSHCCDSTITVLGHCDSCEQECDEVISEAALDLIEQAYVIADSDPLSGQAVAIANRLSSETM